MEACVIIKFKIEQIDNGFIVTFPQIRREEESRVHFVNLTDLEKPLIAYIDSCFNPPEEDDEVPF